MTKVKTRRYPHLAARIFGTPLMIEPRKLTAILQALGPRLEIPTEGEPEQTDKVDRKPYDVTDDGIATIDVVGTLVHRASGMDALSGMTSYQQIGAELAQAVADPDVRGILMTYDSPGGEVAGVFDLADQIRNSPKPIVSFAQDMAASAAYLLASAAGAGFYGSKSSMTGSIGIMLAHTDTSMADSAAGVKVSYIHAGARKVDGAMPLDHEHRASAAALQAEVDRYYGMFTSAVAGYRPNLSVDDVKATEAGVFVGSDAADAGLVDGTMTRAAAMDLLREACDPDADQEEDDAGEENTPEQQTTATTYARRVGQRTKGLREASRPAAFSPEGEGTELGMAEKNIPGVADVTATLRTEKERAEAEILTLKLQLAGRDEVLKGQEDRRKEEVVDKHMKRGAVVPAMLGMVKDLSAVKSADELDKTLAALPVVLHKKAEGAVPTFDGSQPSAGESPLEKLKAIGTKLRAADPKLTPEAAFEAACDQNPGLYREHRKLNPLGARLASTTVGGA